MGRTAIALLVSLVVANSAVSATIFEDHFNANSLGDYTESCDPIGAAGVWSISDGVLHAQSPAWCNCRLTLGDPSWEISSVHFRVNGMAGFDKGIFIVNTFTNCGISVNLRSAPWNDIYVNTNYPSDQAGQPFPLPHTNGAWMDVVVRVAGTDMQVYVNGVHVATQSIVSPESILPLNAIQPVAFAGTSTLPLLIDYDDIVVEGSDVVAIDETSWGALKSKYR